MYGRILSPDTPLSNTVIDREQRETSSSRKHRKSVKPPRRAYRSWKTSTRPGQDTRGSESAQGGLPTAVSASTSSISLTPGNSCPCATGYPQESPGNSTTGRIWHSPIPPGVTFPYRSSDAAERGPRGPFTGHTNGPAGRPHPLPVCPLTGRRISRILARSIRWTILNEVARTHT